MRFLTGMLLGLTVLSLAAFAAEDEARSRELQKEQDRLERETDPVDRAKIGIKISELLLENVGDSARSGDFSAMETSLVEYTATIEEAHQALVDSGRDAQKKAGGFKELEIALRKHVRKFQDVARTLNLEKRVPIEKAMDLANGIRNRLLKALFP
jgi:hypothetical protein